MLPSWYTKLSASDHAVAEAIDCFVSRQPSIMYGVESQMTIILYVRGEVVRWDGDLGSAIGTVEVVQDKTKIDTEFKAEETRQNYRRLYIGRASIGSKL